MYNRGFTLIELIMVITIIAIVAVLVGPIIVAPFNMQGDIEKRVLFVNSADNALRHMKREIRGAIPNSVRVSSSGTTHVIEFMRASDGGRYRLGGSGDDTALFPSGSDDTFQVLGSISAPAAGDRMVVNSTSATSLYTNAASNSGGIITPASTTFSVSGSEVTLSSAYQFDPSGQGSPRRRFFITDTAVVYHCDETTRNIYRYAEYTINSSIPTSRSSAPLSTAGHTSLLLENALDCSFVYQSGTPERAAVLTMALLVGENIDKNSDGTYDGEQIRLMHQVHIRNAP